MKARLPLEKTVKGYMKLAGNVAKGSYKGTARVFKKK
jgi:hypothetical protein